MLVRPERCAKIILTLREHKAHIGRECVESRNFPKVLGKIPIKIFSPPQLGPLVENW